MPAAVVLAIQFALVATAFPLRELWSDLPLFHIDNALHWYLINLGDNLAASAKVAGYDPFFAAGHVNGLHYNLSARFPTLLAVLLPPSVDVIHMYKAYAFGAAVLSPLALVGAAAALRLTPLEALIAGLLGIVMWWVSYLRWYYTAGMVGYVSVIYAAMLFAALLIRYMGTGGGRWVPVGLGLFGAAGFFWHWALPVPVAIVVAAYALIHALRLDRRRILLGLPVIALISLLPNLVWLYATWRYAGLPQGFAAPPGTAATPQTFVDANIIWREFGGLLRGTAHGSKVYPFLLLASLWACSARETRDDMRRIWITLVLAAAALQVLAYLGAANSILAQIQPNRFAPAGYLLLCFPAARGLMLMCRAAQQRAALPLRVFAGAGLAASCLLGAVLAWEMWREVTPGPQGRYGAASPEVRPLGDKSVWILDWLRTRTTADARVLFETSYARIHDEAHMAGYYAYTSGREFIGGPYPGMLVSSAWGGYAFGKRLKDIPHDRMAAYFSLYNIGAIVAHSAAAKAYFDAMPGVRLDSEHGRLRAYLVDGERSYFLKGSGRVIERAHNHLLIADIRGPELVLKYHHVEGMASDPPARIEEVRMLDDPTPFIRIVDPPPRLRLFMR